MTVAATDSVFGMDMVSKKAVEEETVKRKRDVDMVDANPSKKPKVVSRARRGHVQEDD